MDIECDDRKSNHEFTHVDHTAAPAAWDIDNIRKGEGRQR
jgi:hypothetical protein